MEVETRNRNTRWDLVFVNFKSRRCSEVHGKCKVQRSGTEVRIKSRRFGVRSKVSYQGSELRSEIKSLRKKDQRVGVVE